MLRHYVAVAATRRCGLGLAVAPGATIGRCTMMSMAPCVTVRRCATQTAQTAVPQGGGGSAETAIPSPEGAGGAVSARWESASADPEGAAAASLPVPSSLFDLADAVLELASVSTETAEKRAYAHWLAHFEPLLLQEAAQAAAVGAPVATPGVAVVLLRLTSMACTRERRQIQDPRVTAVLGDLCDLACAGIEAPRDAVDIIVASSKLRVGSSAMITRIAPMAVGATALQTMKAAQIVRLLSALSRQVRRLRAVAPDVNRAVGRLRAHEKLTSAQALEVVTSVCRMCGPHDHSEAVTFYTRAIKGSVGEFSQSQLVDAAYCLGHSASVHADFAVAVIDELAARSGQLTPHSMSEVCRALNFIEKRREMRRLREQLSLPITRLLPCLSERADELAGQFERRQARNVVNCFMARKVKAGVAFAKLCRAGG